MIGNSTDGAKFYASFFGGAAIVGDIDYDSSAGQSGVITLDPGYNIDGSVGYAFGNGLSIEGQLGYLNAALNGASYGAQEFGASGSVSALYGMINAWYGFDLGGITPFFGGGIGFANLTLDSNYDPPFYPASFTETQMTYAAQLGFGVALALADNVDLVGRYRYFATGDVVMTDGQLAEVTASLGASIIDVGLKVSF